jgi:glutamate-1-semialdehyde aminotransferase
VALGEEQRLTHDQRVIVRIAESQLRDPTKGRSVRTWAFFSLSRYRGVVTKQTTVRLPDDLADEAEAVARVQGTSVNALIVESLTAEIERVRADKGFTKRARKLLARDQELLDRLAR